MQSAMDSLIPRQKLGDILHTLSISLDLPVRVVDESGALMEAHGPEPCCCKLLGRSEAAGAICQKTRQKAGQRAQALGESYIFSCHAGLSLIAFPLLSRGTLLGSVIAGPFLMGEPEAALAGAVSETYGFSPSLSLEWYDALWEVKVVPPAQAGAMGKLISHLLSPLFPAESRVLLKAQEKLYQQSRINETVQRYKSQGVPMEDGYPYEMEKELLVKVKTGDVQAAKGVLNDLLGYVLFSGGGHMDVMKNRALELTTLLSRVAIEGGAVTDRVFRLNNRFLSNLREIDDFESLCYQLQEVVESFVDALLPPAGGVNHAVAAAVGYIAKHYSEPLTLIAVAGKVNLSPTYFSAQFHKAVGMGFKAYLNRVRVEESKRLLSATADSMTDIAIAMGFSDQSSFSKTFKKYTGLSPRHYR